MRPSEDILRDLSLLSQNDRTILSVYLALDKKKDDINDWIERQRKNLVNEIDSNQQDFLDTSIDFMNDYLNEIWNTRPKAIAFFSDLGADFIQGIELMNYPEKNLMILDDEAHIRQLAFELDEYEPVGILMADASGARIMLAAGKTIDSLNEMKTKIHHLSKVGGWSQMRYQRRRQKEVIHYVKDIVSDAEKIFRETEVNRILLAGRERMLATLEEYLPKWLKDKVMGKIAWDMHGTDDEFLAKIQPEMEKLERQQELEALSLLHSEIKKQGLASTGLVDTMKALQLGQVDTLFLKKDLEPSLSENLTSLAESISAHVEFIPKNNKCLDSFKGVAALLRYKIR